ncbi:protein draper-like [Crassostrea angulata]|uniref:protein draper-like n=1 Tax=Magallana angulata TaxID=2784310 RepID=UPI0022B1ABFB|nr:protein draper-like [Crassostrea angulata]
MYRDSMDITMIIFIFYLGLSNSKFCERSGVLECCLGYIWNKIENRCIPCGKGYIGQNCGNPCPSPYYGQECMSMCNCADIQYCNHVHGCIKPQGDACQNPMLKPEEHMNTTSLMWTVIVCLFVISITFFSTYLYLKLRKKPNVIVSETL